MYSPIIPFRTVNKYSNKLTYVDSARRLITKSRITEDGLLVSEDFRLAILQPIKTSDKLLEYCLFSYEYSVSTVVNWLSNRFSKSEYLAVDLETKGTEAHNAECRIVGIGFSNGSNNCYVDWETCGDEVKEAVLQWLANTECKLVGHNIAFDACWLQRETGLFLNWHVCTFAMYKQLANEGFFGQTWGLKDAQVELLGWQDRGDEELNEWLIKNNYWSDAKKRMSKGRYQVLNAKGKVRYAKPSKGEMWRAPAEIIGKYCALDALSTWQLLTQVFLPSIQDKEWRENYWWFHTEVFITNIKWLCEQQLLGMSVDYRGMSAYQPHVEYERDVAVAELYSHEQVQDYLVARKLNKLNETIQAEPKKRYCKQQKNKPQQETVQYQKWRDSVAYWQQVDPATIAAELFNPNSSDQLVDFFYNFLGLPILQWTKSDKPSTGAKALPKFGQVGKLLRKVKDKEKELGYIAAVLEHSYEHAQGLHRLHPQYRAPGTITGRLSGSGGVNCFPASVELLTRRGWISATEVQDTDEVWQVDPDTLQGTFVHPLHIIQQQYRGPLWGIGGEARGELWMTENHRMPWYGGGNQQYKYLFTDEIQNMFSQTRLNAAMTSRSATSSPHSERDIWMATMIQADGNKEAGRKTWQLGFRKQRKIIKARELTGKPGNVYENMTRFGRVQFSSDLLNTETKTLNLTNLGTEHVLIFLDALAFWDGYRVNTKGLRIEYDSTVKENIDQVMAYVCRAGYSATCHVYHTTRGHPVYRVYITENTYTTIKKNKHIRVDEYFSGAVGCVTVPSGHILVRSEGRVWVTGNCQQLTKRAGFLVNFRPEPGRIWLDFDIKSLEQVVLAELSGDQQLMKLYGPGANPNHDVYLTNGAHLPKLGERIRAAGYDPDSPTEEGAANAKTECKKERAISKTITLGSSYGAGAKTIRESLELLADIELTLDEAQELHAAYWSLYGEVKQYEARLLTEWKRRGYVMSGTGTPVACDVSKKKDMVNRVVQRTGHECLMIVLWRLHVLRQESGVEFVPVIPDYHDELIVECANDEKTIDAVSELVQSAFDWLNDKLGGQTTLQKDGGPISNLAYAKLEKKQVDDWFAEQQVKSEQLANGDDTTGDNDDE